MAVSGRACGRDEGTDLRPFPSASLPDTGPPGPLSGGVRGFRPEGSLPIAGDSAAPRGRGIPAPPCIWIPAHETRHRARDRFARIDRSHLPNTVSRRRIRPIPPALRPGRARFRRPREAEEERCPAAMGRVRYCPGGSRRRSKRRTGGAANHSPCLIRNGSAGFRRNGGFPGSETGVGTWQPSSRIRPSTGKSRLPGQTPPGRRTGSFPPRVSGPRGAYFPAWITARTIASPSHAECTWCGIVEL